MSSKNSSQKVVPGPSSKSRPASVPKAKIVEEEEEDAQYSEPEEVDNEGMMEEAADYASEGTADDDDDDADMVDDDEEEQKSSSTASNKKRSHGDISSGTTSTPTNSSAKKSKSAASFVIPSSEEMAALRQTEELFQSNLFKLALEELLKEIQVDYSAEGKIKKIEPILRGLKDKIDGMTPTELTYNPHAPAFGAPFPSTVTTSVAAASSANTSSALHTFPFLKPSAFHLVGSYPLHTGMREGTGAGRAGLNIDLSLEIPGDCLKQKDYWDYRYLAKRARWLQHIAEFLHRSGEFEVKLGKMRGATEKPVLLLYPLKQVDNGWVPFTGILGKTVIRVFAQPPAGFFNPKRFHPSKSNIHATSTIESKIKVKKENGTTTASPKHQPDDSNESTGAPTPYYNSLLAEDLFYTTHLAQLYELAQSPSIRETILLLRLWARQRRLDLGRGLTTNGGWGEYELKWSGTSTSDTSKTPSKKDKKKSTSSTASRLELVSPDAYLYDAPAGGMTGFNGFFFSVFLLHLMQTKAIYRAMSTYQLFKQTLQQLLKLDMLAGGLSGSDASAGVVLGFDPTKSLHSLTLLTNPLAGADMKPKEVEFLQQWSASNGHEVLFLDAEGLINFTARVGRETYLELKQECFLSLSMLDDSATLLSNIFGNGLLENAASAAAAGTVSGVNASTIELQTLLSTSKPLASSTTLGADTFTTLFCRPLDFHKKYDAFIRLKLGSLVEWKKNLQTLHKTMGASFLTVKQGLAQDADVLTMLVRQIQALLELALGDRMILLHLRPIYSSSTNTADLEIGLLLNPFHSSRILDAGPSADHEVDAQRFRDLWGELSTLRRFKDGAIIEAVVWTTPGTQTTNLPHSAPHLIPFQIISYVLGRHLSIPATKIEFIFNQFESLLKLRTIESQPLAQELVNSSIAAKDRTPLLLSGPNVDPLFLHSTTLFTSFKALSTTLKSLHQEIPLHVISIRMLGEFSRYTGVFPPTPIDITKLAPNTSAHALNDVIPVLMQFESSSKWPEDSLAISRIKSAFYIQIGSALQTRDIHSLVSLNALDIFYHGFIFRLKIFYEQEFKIRQVEEKLGQVTLGSPMIPVPTSLEIQREFIFGSQLSLQLKFVQETYPLFAPTARLVKRWLSAHMFTSYFPIPEVIELLVAHIFTNPKPYSRPGSSFQGFYRWLDWLVNMNFVSSPLVVDLGGDMKAETIEIIQAKFTQHRQAGTGSLIYIATEHDRESEYLFPRQSSQTNSEANLDQFILDRLVSYARSSLQHLDSLLSSSNSQAANAAVWKSAFKTPTDLVNTFDIIIHLKPEALPVHQLTKAIAPPATLLASSTQGQASLDKKSKGYKLPPDAIQSQIQLSSEGSSSSQTVPLIDFSPIRSYVTSLRHLFGSRAYFFYDPYGGSIIGVKWRPEFKSQLESEDVMKFSVKATQQARPVHDKKGQITGLKVNLEEILSDFERAGKGLVDKIQRV